MVRRSRTLTRSVSEETTSGKRGVDSRSRFGLVKPSVFWCNKNPVFNLTGV